jgi:UDP-N-acetyl-D-mannosaminuronate dehydrogenase
MYLRSFTKNGKKYYYIAKAVRKGDKVIQKSILYVGTADTMYKKLIGLKQKS